MCRDLLSQYGKVLRIYLTPEDPAITRKRKKYKKNRRPKHVDGWVEFASKKVAKRVARALNATPIGGKKRDRYAEDIWNMKYLSKFKWHHLTDKIAYQRTVRDQRVRNDMMEAKRETKFFIEKSNLSKKIARKRKKEEEGGAGQLPEAKKKRGFFKQRTLLKKGEKS